MAEIWPMGPDKMNYGVEMPDFIELVNYKSRVTKFLRLPTPWNRYQHLCEEDENG